MFKTLCKEPNFLLLTYKVYTHIYYTSCIPEENKKTTFSSKLYTTFYNFSTRTSDLKIKGWNAKLLTMFENDIN